MMPGTITNGGESWRVHAVAPDVRLLLVRDMPALAPGLDAEVSALWEAAQRRMAGALFNGRVFSADAIAPGLITGHWTEFRRIVAQMDRPELYAGSGLHGGLGVRPLAVGGLILGPDGVVFGRRPAGAIYQAGEWQLPPAGSIDPGAERAGGRVDAPGQLLTELAEELGLPAAAVDEPVPLCIVEHPGSHVLDFGFSLHTRLRAPAIRAAHAAEGNAEYGALEIVPVAGLAGFLAGFRAGAGDLLTGQARFFLAHAGLLPDGA
jgi:hypothetical protein